RERFLDGHVLEPARAGLSLLPDRPIIAEAARLAQSQREQHLRLYLFIVVAFVMASLLVGCSRSSARPATPASPTSEPPVTVMRIAAGQPLTVAVSAALSGEQRAVGGDTAAAAEMAVAVYGNSLQGHALRVLQQDDGCSDPEMAAAVAHDIVGDSSVAGVIGPGCTTGA